MPIIRANRDRTEEERQTMLELLSSPDDIGIPNPSAETVEPSKLSLMLGAGTGGLFGSDPILADSFGGQASVLGGELLQMAGFTVAGGLLAPAANPLTTSGIRTLTRWSVAQAPMSMVRNAPRVGMNTIDTAARVGAMGAAASQPSAFLLEEDPAMMAALFTGGDVAGFLGFKGLYSVYSRVQKNKRLAQALDSARDARSKATEPPSMQEIVDNSKILTGEIPFKAKASEISGRVQKEAEKVKSSVGKLNQWFKQFDEVQKTKTRPQEKITKLSEQLGVGQVKPQEIEEGVVKSHALFREAVEDLGGVSPAERELLKETIGEGTFLAPTRNFDKIIDRVSTVGTRETGREFLPQGVQRATAPTPQQFITRSGTVVGRSAEVDAKRAEQIANRANYLREDLHMANLKSQIGLKQDTPDTQVIAKLEELEKKYADAGVDLMKPSKKEMQLTQNIQEELDNLAKMDLDAVDPSLRETTDFLNFSRNANKWMKALQGEGTAADTQKMVSEVEAMIDRAGNQFATRNEKFMEDAKKVLKGFGKKEYEQVKQFEEQIKVTGLSDDLELDEAGRQSLLDYIVTRVDNLPEELFPPQIAQAERKMYQQAVEQGSTAAQRDFLQNHSELIARAMAENPAVLESTIDRTGDDTLRKAYYLYQASLGSRTARARLKAIDHAAPGRMNVEATLGNVEPSTFVVSGGQLRRAAAGEVAEELPEGTIHQGMTVGRETPEEFDKFLASKGRGKGKTADTTIDESYEALQNVKLDVGTFERTLRGFRRLSEVYIDKTRDNPRMQKLFQAVRRLGDRWQDNYILSRREWVQAEKEIDDFFSKGLKPNTTAGQRATQFIRQVDDTISTMRHQPEVKAAAKTAGQDLEEFLKVQEREMLAKQDDFTKEMYRKYRAFDDNILDDYNNQVVKEVNRRVDSGEFPEEFRMKEVPRRTGHAPLIYDGDYYVKVVTREVNPKTGREKQKILYSDFVYGEREAFDSIEKWMKDHRNAYGNLPGEVHVIPRIFQDDPDINALMSIMEESKSLFGQDAGFLAEQIAKKQFRPDNLKEVFFAGAQPRLLNAVEQRIGVEKALELRTFMANKAIHFTIPRLETELVAKQMQKEGLPKWAKYLRTYANDNIGRSRGLEQNIDEYIGAGVEKLFQIPSVRKVLLGMGFTPNGRNTRALVRGLTFFGRAAALGINLGTAFINMMLGVTNVMSLASFRSIKKGLAHTADVFMPNSPYKNLSNRLGLQLTSGGLGYMENLSSPSAFMGNSKKIFKWLDEKLMWAFNNSEDMTRMFSAVVFRDQADELAAQAVKGVRSSDWKFQQLLDIAGRMGKEVTDPSVLDEYAVQMVRKTNFIFDPTDAAEIFRSVPLKPFLQFKNFFANEVEFLFEMHSKSKKDFFKILGAFGALGGVMAIPGTQDLNAISRTMFGFDMELWAQENMPEVMVGGFFTLGGINGSGRMNLGDAAYLTQNPAGMAPSKIAAGLNYLRRGERDKAMAVLTPNGVRTALQAIELATTGEIRDPFSGGIATVKAEDQNALATAFRAMTGIPTTTEHAFRVAKSGLRSQRMRAEAHRRGMMSRAIDAMREGDFAKMNKIAKEAGFKRSEIETAAQKADIGGADFLRQIPLQEDRPQWEDTFERFE